MASYIDINGHTQQVELDASIYRQAHQAGQSVRTFINTTHPVRAGEPSAFEQLCASEGMFMGRNREYGIRPATLDAVLDGVDRQAGSIVKDAVPASRILFPVFQMAAVEDKLRDGDYGIISQFEGAAAVTDTIEGDRFERPILNFSKPEQARSRAIAQLSEPASMLTITASDKAFRITGTSIGLEVADQALRATSLDIVTMAMTRQYEVEMLEKVEAMQLAFMNGDSDLDMAALSGASVKKAKDFDSAITTSGVLTQDAWVQWLFNKNRKRRIDYVITDIKGALAIERRTGRPTVQGDNATSKRIDTLENIINPAWADTVKVFLTQDPNWPANTILGFDSRYGYHHVKSTMLDYAAAEAYAMRRSTKYRIDSGMVAYRLFDEAWDVLQLVAP